MLIRARLLRRKSKKKAASWSVAFVEVEEIDTINIYWAGILAMRRAVEGLRVAPQHLLIAEAADVVICHYFLTYGTLSGDFSPNASCEKASSSHIQ
jgi:ribonuclease HII